MQKTLPINLDIPLFFRAWEAVRLPVILTNKRNYDWFIDKFNSIMMDTDFSISYCFWDSLERLRVYDDILDYTRLTAYNPNNLLEIIIETINKNQYLIAALDPSQMESSPHYRQNKGLIDTLVFGYDNDEQSLYLIDIEIKDLSQGYVKISYQDFVAGFFSAYDYLKTFDYHSEEGDYKTIGFLIQNGPLSAFSLREASFEPKLPNFYWQLKKNLYGGEFTVKKFDDIVYPGRRHLYYKTIDKRHIGVSVYKGYYETLRQLVSSEGPNVLGYSLVTWSVKSLSLIKSLLSDKLTYLTGKGLIRVDSEIIAENNEVCKKLFTCFMLLTKYKHTNNLKYFDEFCDMMKMIEELDMSSLSNICKILYDQVNTYYLPDIEMILP